MFENKIKVKTPKLIKIRQQIANNNFSIPFSFQLQPSWSATIRKLSPAEGQADQSHWRIAGLCWCWLVASESSIVDSTFSNVLLLAGSLIWRLNREIHKQINIPNKSRDNCLILVLYLCLSACRNRNRNNNNVHVPFLCAWDDAGGVAMEFYLHLTLFKLFDRMKLHHRAWRIICKPVTTFWGFPRAQFWNWSENAIRRRAIKQNFYFTSLTIPFLVNLSRVKSLGEKLFFLFIFWQFFFDLKKVWNQI